MRHRRRLALALVSMAAGAAASVAFGAPALAAPGDPAGNNGTVKIDGYIDVDNPTENDNDVNNEPHVPCTFDVEFFGFDEGQTADIKLWGHPPSSQQVRFDLLIDLQDQVVSDDPAGGANPDPDKVFSFTAEDLEEAGLEPHPNQGFHLRLDVFSEGLPGGQKHKVFWVQECEESPSPPTSPSNGNGGNGSKSPSTPAEESPGEDDEGPSLPVTGVAATSLAVAGLGLIGGGAALLWLRRRRDITFTS